MTPKQKLIIVFGFLIILLFYDIVAQTLNNEGSKKISKTEKSKTAEEYFERANSITKSKMFSLDSTTTSNAVEYYLKAIELKPKFWQARRNYARQMIIKKKYDIAISQLNEALNIVNSKENPELILMRGQAYYENGQFEKAILDFDEAIKFSGNIDYLLLYKAKAQWKLGQIENACISYNKALKITPSFVDKKDFIICD